VRESGNPGVTGFPAILDSRFRGNDEGIAEMTRGCKRSFLLPSFTRGVDTDNSIYEITKTLPKKLKNQLPSPEAISRLLESI
jgi:hypothetical protein